MSARLLVWLTWLTAIVSTRAFGQDGEPVGYLLDLPPGARAIGMGSAQGAVAEDADAAYWNPAALGFLEPDQAATFTYSRLRGLENYPFVHAAYAHSIPKLHGAIAASFAYFDVGEQTAFPTDETYRPHELAPGVAFGGQIGEGLAVGIGFKVYQIDFSRPDDESDEGSSTTFLFDGGVLWRTQDYRLMVGGTLQNLGPDLELSPGESNPPARNLKLSLGSHLVDERNARLAVAADLNIPLAGESNAPHLMVGGEMRVGPYAAMRIGLHYDGWVIEDDEFTENLDQYATTLGFGVRVRGIEVDYANAPWFVLSLRRSHHITVSAHF
jgi:hypothetical protein